jgi:hypothetical protein
MTTAPNLWQPEPATLWPDDQLPERNRDEWRSLAAELRRDDETDRARMIRTKARGGVWYCPGACTSAEGDVCECPCGRQCHGRACIGH